MGRERVMTLEVETPRAALTTEDMSPARGLSRRERAEAAARQERRDAPKPELTAEAVDAKELAEAALIEAEAGKARIIEATEAFVAAVEEGVAAVETWKTLRSRAIRAGVELDAPPLYEQAYGLPPTSSWHRAFSGTLTKLGRAVSDITNL
jgi:hypothetical protein